MVFVFVLLLAGVLCGGSHWFKGTIAARATRATVFVFVIFVVFILGVHGLTGGMY